MTHRLRSLRLGLLCLSILAWAPCAEAVVPVLIGPFQAFLALLPSILSALGVFVLALFKPATFKKLFLFLWHQKVFTLCLVFLIGGVWYASANDWWLGGSASELEGGTAWPAFRGGTHRRGYVPGQSDPTVGDPIWDYVREKTFWSSPTIVGNRVYVANANPGYFQDKGAIICLDTETGVQAWRYDADGYRATFSSPSVKDGYLVCGEGLHVITDARIVCLDAKTGKRKWSYRTQSHVESSPCIADGRAYIGAGDDGYYCFRLKPTEDGEPEKVWHVKGKRYKDCETSPIVHEGVCYFGLGAGGKAIVAVKADTGEELWRVNTPYPVFGPPSIADGRLYVAMGNGDFVFSAEEVRTKVIEEMKKREASPDEIARAQKELGPGGEIWAVDLETHEPVPGFPFKLARTVLGAVAVANDRLYFGSRDKHVYCVSTDGRLIRKWNAHAEIKTSPAVGESHVYVVTESKTAVAGTLHCLTADGLDPVWEARLGAGPNFFSSPTVARGHVYVGTPKNGLRCIGRTGAPPPVVWSNGDRGGPVDRAPVPDNVKPAWRYSPKTAGYDEDNPAPRGAPDSLTVTAPLMSLGRSVFVPCVRNGKPELLKLSTKGKRELKGDPRVERSAPCGQPVTVAPVGMGDRVFAVEGPPGDAGRVLRCIDADTLEDRWTLPIRSDASGGLAIDRQCLLVWTGEKTLRCYPLSSDERPESLWTLDDLGGAGVFAPELSDGIVFVASEHRLAALDSLTGASLWRKPVELPAPPTGSPLRAERLLLVPSEAGITAYDLRNGDEMWTAKIGAVRVSPSVDRERVVAVTEKGALHLLSLRDGSALRPPTRRVIGSVPPMLVSGRILYAARGGVWQVSAVKKERARKIQAMSSYWLGQKMVTPLLLLDSKLYLATEKWGVICLRPK